MSYWSVYLLYCHFCFLICGISVPLPFFFCNKLCQNSANPPFISKKGADILSFYERNSMAVENINQDLPEDMIWEILLWLAGESLLRFKSVCKLWRSLISEPSFAESHFKRSATHTHTLICHQDHQVLSVVPEALLCDDPATSKVLPRLPTSSSLGVVGSCRGFLMLNDYSNVDPDFILWNPLTGDHKRIPYSCLATPVDGRAFFDCPLLYGFGYDASKDDYLIVAARVHNPHECHWKFFSVRANLWNELEVTFPGRVDLADSSGFFLNGAIHWLVGGYILAFDMMERNFSEIPLPVTDGHSLVFGLLGGYLSVSFRTLDGIAEIWIMKKYKVHSSWTSVWIFDRSFHAIYFTEGSEFIGLDGSGGLVKYNDKGELLEHRECFLYKAVYWMHTESLLSLPSEPGRREDDLQ